MMTNRAEKCMFVIVLIFIGTALKSQQTLGVRIHATDKELMPAVEAWNSSVYLTFCSGQASVHFSPPQARWHQIRVQIRSKPGANLKPKYFRQSEVIRS
uniref:Secreted protein n=1 Tax=Macrostomum lignano TaxID=282301 RepID=A0A1I8G3F0_9PLAT